MKRQSHSTSAPREPAFTSITVHSPCANSVVQMCGSCLRGARTRKNQVSKRRGLKGGVTQRPTINRARAAIQYPRQISATQAQIFLELLDHRVRRHPEEDSNRFNHAYRLPDEST